MVTSNKLLDKKVVKMAEQNNSAVIPQRTLLGEVNEQITCPLCRGYYIDATTIVECLHSFCRSCIIKHLQVKSYCPVCEMMINSAKPNIKLDKALQDIVYKLVPGLFQKEMERRQQFYSSRPGPAASATPEQRGEDTERIIFSPEDVISFSLEYSDATDTDSISSKSSDSNEPHPTGNTRRFLQCPAVVNISHLKKFLSMKFDIDSTQFAIDILYKRVPLPDYYTLMDIAYIYNWKRNEPMRFFYQIIDYVAIRNRLFDINRKGSHFRDGKSSPTPTEDTNISSPAHNLNDQGSEISSGTDSPMPDENNGKKENNSTTDKNHQQKDGGSQGKPNSNTSKKNDDEVEKSQFLNSFELTAKNNCQSTKTPVKGDSQETSTSVNNEVKTHIESPKVEDNLKRKQQTPPKTPETKKLKIELEKAKIPQIINKQQGNSSVSSPGASESSIKSGNVFDNLLKSKENADNHVSQPQRNINSQTQPNQLPTPKVLSKEQKPQTNTGKPVTDGVGVKRSSPGTANMSSPKRKTTSDITSSVTVPNQSKTVSPLKLQVPKLESQFSLPKPSEISKPTHKRMPDLKPTVPSSQMQNKMPINKVRMDLLANNSDPTIDRSKILSQVKSSLGVHNAGQSSGDPLKSLLLDSCKINIPSSLSITLTDQKLDTRSSSDPITTSDPKKIITNKNLVAAASGVTHKVPSPPVHNYIEILKLPDSNPKKQQNKTDANIDTKPNQPGKAETSTAAAPVKLPGKSSESAAKGPVPNLKPIADTKLGKQQSGNFVSPITFQQTFEQQIQTLQSDKKTKLPKNKAQVPKLVPATPKTLSTVNKLNNPNTKSSSSNTPTENKPNAALDLTTPHNVQSQLGQHQSRLLETMQTIANLAKKQNQPMKGLPTNVTPSSVYSSISNRPVTTVPSPLRIPTASSISQAKQDKVGGNTSQASNIRQEIPTKSFQVNQTGGGNSIMSSPSYQPPSHSSPSAAQPSPRSQTRSPSSSPKLVIAEEKQASGSSEQNINQSNQISSTQLPILNSLKSDSSKCTPGSSKTVPKPMKPLTPGVKLTGIRQPITPTLKSSPTMNVPTDYMTPPQLMAQHALIPHLRHQMEIQNWYKAKHDLLKSMANAGYHNQHDFNNKEK